MYTYSIAMQRTSQSNPHEKSIFARVRRRSITPHNPLILSNTTFLCLRLRSPPPFISWRHGPDPPPPLLALLSSWPVRSPSRHLAQKVASLQPAYAFSPSFICRYRSAFEPQGYLRQSVLPHVSRRVGPPQYSPSPPFATFHFCWIIDGVRILVVGVCRCYSHHLTKTLPLHVFFVKPSSEVIGREHLSKARSAPRTDGDTDTIARTAERPRPPSRHRPSTVPPPPPLFKEFTGSQFRGSSRRTRHIAHT